MVYSVDQMEGISTMATRFNWNLLRTMKEAGLTQRDVARLVGEHESILSRMVNGSFVPDERRKILYARALGKKPQELFGDNG